MNKTTAKTIITVACILGISYVAGKTGNAGVLWALLLIPIFLDL